MSHILRNIKIKRYEINEFTRVGVLEGQVFNWLISCIEVVTIKMI